MRPVSTSGSQRFCGGPASEQHRNYTADQKTGHETCRTVLELAAMHFISRVRVGVRDVKHTWDSHNSQFKNSSVDGRWTARLKTIQWMGCGSLTGTVGACRE
jgi:hypothetical protein